MSTPDLKLNSDYDIVLSDGDLAQVTGDDAIAQAIRIAINSIKGEWFLNTEFGLNHDILFAKPPKLVEIRREFRRVVMGVEGVKAMYNFAAGYDTDNSRQLNVVFSVVTENNTELIITEGITAL